VYYEKIVVLVRLVNAENIIKYFANKKQQLCRFFTNPSAKVIDKAKFVVSNLCFTKLEPIEGKVLQEINKIN
jgi:hypothetical protein